MNFLERGFESALELQTGEVVRWRGPATHRVARSWVGGRIFVSDRRFFFCPGALSRRRHEIVRLPLGEIAGVDELSRSSHVSAGGLRRRLAVRTHAGREHVFSMPGFGRRAPELRALLLTGAAGSEPGPTAS